MGLSKWTVSMLRNERQYKCVFHTVEHIIDPNCLIFNYRKMNGGRGRPCLIGILSERKQLGPLWHPVVNSLRPSDAIWRQWSGSTLSQVMVCCLTAPSHYLNQCWLIISYVPWHSSEGITIRRSLEIPINETRLKIAFLKTCTDVLGANELTLQEPQDFRCYSFGMMLFTATNKCYNTISAAWFCDNSSAIMDYIIWMIWHH